MKICISNEILQIHMLLLIKMRTTVWCRKGGCCWKGVKFTYYFLLAKTHYYTLSKFIPIIIVTKLLLYPTWKSKTHYHENSCLSLALKHNLLLANLKKWDFAWKKFEPAFKILFCSTPSVSKCYALISSPLMTWNAGVKSKKENCPSWKYLWIRVIFEKSYGI